MTRIHPSRGPALVLAALLVGGLGACTDVRSDNGNSGSGFPVGSVQDNLATGYKVVIESNSKGEGSTLRLVGNPLWGRLVDVRATDPATTFTRTYFVDYVIGAAVGTTPDQVLDRNPATGRETLTILHDFGSPEFESAFSGLEAGLQEFIDRGLGANEIPPYTALPRNAAMVVRFNDVLEDGGNPSDPGYPGTVSPSTIHLNVGYPPTAPFESRILPDPNHGDFINGTFHSTRVIIDMSVSQEEASQAGISPNPIGLPEAVTITSPSAVVRIPTQTSVITTQFELLTNLVGSTVSFSGNGSTDPFSPTLDVVRAFRPGGRTSITGDAYNGFLLDDTRPRLMGSQGVTIDQVQVVAGGFLVDFTYGTPACGSTPKRGDLLILPQIVARVVQDANPPSGPGQVKSVYFELLSGNPAGFIPGSIGEFRTAWDPNLAVAGECFIRFSPGAGILPSTKVSAGASVVVGFDEPMLPESLSSFDGILVRSTSPSVNPMKRNVTAVVTAGLDLQDFTFGPQAPFDHTSGNSESYTVTVVSDDPTTANVIEGVTDLAGNPLAVPLPTTTFTLNDLSPSSQSGSIQATFSEFLQSGASSANVDDNLDLLPEWRGQYVADPGRGRIQARSVTRFAGTADASQAAVAAMIPPLLPGTQTPLAGHGSRAMLMWRYFDLGMSLLDETTFNIDVEGLAWSPVSLGVSTDNFSQFQIGLSHSQYLPDEALDSALLPLAANSGLNLTFDQNVLDTVNDPLSVVHPRSLGYTIQPLDQFVASSGTFMQPWPLNRNRPQSEYTYYTWRDTTLEAVGAPFGNGADPVSLINVDPNAAPVYGADKVPTIGLPLLMDFRTYPDSQSTGINRLSYLEANLILVNVAQQPYFRVHSTGGALPSNPTGIVVNPDQEITATGGINVAGQPTLAGDNAFYVGQADFVVRVSRVHSIWFDAGIASNWTAPVWLPGQSQLPSGTAVSLAYRGAVGITGAGFNDATNVDMYGNKPVGFSGYSVIFLNGDSAWKTSLPLLDGARFVQVRATLISNVESQIEPSIAALGLTHYN